MALERVWLPEIYLRVVGNVDSQQGTLNFVFCGRTEGADVMWYLRQPLRLQLAAGGQEEAAVLAVAAHDATE